MAVDAHRLRSLISQYRRGFSLPQAFYTDPVIFQADLDAVFGREWIFAASEAELPDPGDRLTLSIGRESILVLRDQHGDIRAFHNVCRHRGSRLCLEERGRGSVIVCPYHQWTYGLDGRLRAARQMPKDFDRTGHGLLEVHVALLCGMIYLCLAADPPDIEPFRRDFTPYAAPFDTANAKVAARQTLIEQGSWKLVIENNRECYHCIGNHPELLVSLVDFPVPNSPAEAEQFDRMLARKAADWDRIGVPYRAVNHGKGARFIRLPFHHGRLSFTLDGAPAVRRLMGTLTEPDLGSVRMYRAPSNWNHFVADHVVHFRVLPLAADRTELTTTWLVHRDAVEGVDYDTERLTEVWRITNEQDRRLIENNQQGIASAAYRPGPYAPAEAPLADFCDWYLERLERFLGAPGGRVALAAASRMRSG